MRKTLTNIKRIDRLKITIWFIVSEIIIALLFSYFGIIKTEQASESNTTVITTVIGDFKYINWHASKTRLDYYNIYCEGEKYHLDNSIVTINSSEMSVLFEASPRAKIITDRYNNIVELQINGNAYALSERYNQNQTAQRTGYIIWLCITEIFIIPLYVLYMIFHRTSKDKTPKKRKKFKNSSHISRQTKST